MPDSSSSSGFINELLLSDDSQDYQLISTTRHSRIYKTTRKGRIFVLKAANPENSENPDSTALLLQREYQILSNLDNPFIIRTYGFIDNPQIGYCLILDYVDGVPLDLFLATKPSHRTRRRIIEELLDAVQYLDARQVAHMDLKPSNILITNNGNHVKLIDFGFADSDSQTLNNLGCTNHYASPEQLNGETADYRSDIYTLGKIIRTIEPFRYYLPTCRCLSTKPSHRYSDIASLSKSIRFHRTFAYLLLFITIVLSGIALLWQNPSILPNHNLPPTRTDTLLVLDTTFVHDTVTVTPADPAQPLINEIHQWYDKAFRHFLTSVSHLEYPYSDFEAMEFAIFGTKLLAIKHHYQNLHPNLVNQIENDYIAQYSLFYEKHIAANRRLPQMPYKDEILTVAMNQAYARVDSLRTSLEHNPQLVFKTL